ncbi:MAG: thermostable hemolysin [Mariprofundaceae bacterium]|nr:thermostable hemolysin [Mariprofundaceae bacterium]
MLFDIIDTKDSRRKQAERMIHDRFQEVYGANIRQFMPKLLHLSSREHHDIAMLGFRPASEERLFLERYLHDPIEIAISNHVVQPVQRDEIVEVGNLADFRSGGARAAIVAACAFLYGAGYSWVVFTGVPMLYNAFYRLGLEPVIIAEAHQASLNCKEQDEWGNYYETSPKVMFGNIHEGQEALEYNKNILHPLWEKAVEQGRIKKQTV